MEYKCRICGAIFDESEAGTRIEEHHEVAELGIVPVEQWDCCPACGSEDIEKAEHCLMCGRVLEDGELDYCSTCKEAVIRQLERYVIEPMKVRYGIDEETALKAIDSIAFCY